MRGNKLVIPKFTEGVKYRDDSRIPSEVRQIVVTSDVERYYASMQYESMENPVKGSGVIGIVMGVKAFLTTSDGLQVEPLNALRKVEKKLKREQRRLSRKKKGSNNKRKLVVEIQKVYQKIRDARTDFNHKVSTAIAKRCGIVVVEDLNIQGMTRNTHLSKSVIEQGWYQFKHTLIYKLRWRGAELVGI